MHLITNLYTQWMSHNHTNYNPLYPLFPSATRHKGHDNQDYMSCNYSIRGNELVLTAALLPVAIGHLLNQGPDPLVFW